MSRAVIAALAAGVIVLGVSTWLVLDWRAQRAEEIAAANAEVRAGIAEMYGAMEEAATAASTAATELHLILQEHLTVTERTDEELAADRQAEQAELISVGQRLQELAEAPHPELPEMAERRALRDDLDALSDMQRDAEELGQILVAAAGASDMWASALQNLRAQADRYVETVEGQPDTSDPARLRELWAEEQEVLQDYREAAQLAADVPGLVELAEAYLAYVDANIEFAAEAIELLEEDEIDEYNERLRDTYGEEDPFGFQEAVATATQQSFDVGVLAELAELRQNAASFAARLASARAEVTPEPLPTPGQTPGPS
jgi:hypothetical protein